MDENKTQACPIDAGIAHKNHASMHMHGSEGLKLMAQSVRKEIEGLVKSGSVILDFGCGAGHYCKFLDKYASKLYCIDISEDALLETKTAVPRAITMKDTLGIDPGSVDLVLFANSFHDIRDKDKVIMEMDRILRKDGRIIILDWKKEEMETGPPYRLRMSESDYMKLFSNYVILERFDTPSTHFGMVLARAK